MSMTSREIVMGHYQTRKALPVNQEASEHEQEDQRWKGFWETGGFPYWHANQTPAELLEAVTSGFFAPGASLLDIGCGNGYLSHWLEQQGFSVFGFDCAEVAIDEAKAAYAERPTLQFAALDVCNLPEPPRLFQAAYDRGCMHCLSKAEHPDYVKSIAKWMAPGGHFLIIASISFDDYCLISPEATTEKGIQLGQELTSLFEPDFEVVSIVETAIVLNGEQLVPLPALAIRMVRAETRGH